MSEERTERPTSRRLRKARSQGQIARSRDAGAAAQLVAVVTALVFAGRYVVDGLGNAMQRGLEQLTVGVTGTLTISDVNSAAIATMLTFVRLVAPIAIVSAIATLAVGLVQSGGNVASEALTPRFNQLNPVNGLKRLGFSRGGLDLVKMLAAVLIVGWVAGRIVHTTIVGAAEYGRVDPMRAVALGWDVAVRLLKQCAVAFVVVAAGDYALQRWRTLKSLKMTKKEVQDDTKMSEGNPEIKSRVRALQRAAARKRMLAAVPTATVVITNPTHYAVALEYHRDRMFAPRVVAKGKDLIAERIKTIAREHGVPMVENVSLAQALYRGTEIGDVIPADLFGAVAEVLAYLVRLKQIVV